MKPGVVNTTNVNIYSQFNNNDFSCKYVYIIEDQAQWHNKTKGLIKLIIV